MLAPLIVTSRRLPGRTIRRGSAGAPPFNGIFAPLFPGAFGIWQSNLGLTYGGTPLANAGNTSTTVLSLTGSLATAPIPIWWKATNTAAIGAGATFDIFYDGAGVTPAMSGVTPTAGTPVALTGAATGLSTTWAAGNSVSGDIWKATCSALADQSGNGKTLSQGVAAQQPIVVSGLNGKVFVQFDSTNDFLLSTLLLAQPATTNVSIYTVLASATNGAQPIYLGVASTVTITGPTTNVRMYAGAGLVNGSTMALNTFTRIYSEFTGSTADSNKVGSNAPVTGTSAGNASTPSGFAWGDYTGGTFPSGTTQVVTAVGPKLTAAQLAAIDAAVNSPGGYGPGAIVV